MAHYAFIDDAGTVLEVIVGNDETTGDWETYYASARGLSCKRTSYHTQGGKHLNGGVPFRLNFACVGGQYREDLDAFVPPCPGDGWTLDVASGTWVAPTGG